MRSFIPFRMTLRVRFFTEFTLSRKPRPFAWLRVTHAEGVRMTNVAFPALRHGLQGEGNFLGIHVENVRKKFSD
jgi:hypothetical protein